MYKFLQLLDPEFKSTLYILPIPINLLCSLQLPECVQKPLGVAAVDGPWLLGL